MANKNALDSMKSERARSPSKSRWARYLDGSVEVFVESVDGGAFDPPPTKLPACMGAGSFDGYIDLETNKVSKIKPERASKDGGK